LTLRILEKGFFFSLRAYQDDQGCSPIRVATGSTKIVLSVFDKINIFCVSSTVLILIDESGAFYSKITVP
jgi:hypothetical protein